MYVSTMNSMVFHEGHVFLFYNLTTFNNFNCYLSKKRFNCYDLFCFLKYHLHTQKLNEDTSSKLDTSSLKHMRGLQIRKGENDGVQNHSIKNMECKIAQLAKDKGEKCN